MVKCDYCGKDAEGYAHRCKYCGEVHCSDHLLPEAHECMGLEARKHRNHEKWKETISDSFGGYTKSHQSDHIEEKEEIRQPIKKGHQSKAQNNPKTPHKKQTFSEKLKSYGLEKYEGIKYWLRRREHHAYDYHSRANYLITTALIFAASVVGLIIFYSNAEKLNDIDLWIIKLGGVLILTSLFFAIKYGWRLGNEGINIFKRQRNWFRYLVIILIIILLWQVYTHKDTALNPVFNFYNKTEFSLASPIKLSEISAGVQKASLAVEQKQQENLQREIQSYKTNPKTVSLYNGQIKYEVYGGVNSYLAALPRSITYSYVPPTTRDFIMRDLDNERQKQFLLPLVDIIRNKTSDKDQQARIAVSLVQNIPYDWNGFTTGDLQGRYPYEVLYDGTGVCGEKSLLLAFILRELGFGVAIFEFEAESHRAVGLKCDKGGDYGTQYCFVESTDYYPIGQIPNDYVGGADIRGATPEVVIVSEGYTYDN